MATSNTGLLFEANFNSGTDVTALGFKHSGNKDTPIVDIGGQRAVKISLDHYNSEYAYRTEIQPTKFPSPDFTSGMFAKIGQEYWYGMRYFMDDSWKAADKADSVLMQFHSQPDAGEEWRNPPVSLQVVNKDGVQHLNLIVRSDASKITTGSGEARYDSSKQYDLGPITGDIGKWTDIAWHVKWNHDGTGYLQLYKDGKLLVDLKGANCFNDATGPYLKMGLYKYDWQSSTDTGADTKTIYYDDLRVGNGNASFDTVSNGGSSGGGTTNPTNPPPAPTPSTINGTTGDDKLVGTSKAETIDGKAGYDLLDLTTSTTAGKVDLAAKKADMGGTNVDTLVSVEGVIGSALADELRGDETDNKLRGLAGNDTIDGRGGNDMVAGGDGDDTVYGGAGTDTLYGGNGNDVLNGGAGNDVIHTEAGADLIVVGAVADGTDTVMDFSATEDRIDLSAVKTSTGAGLTNANVSFVADGAATKVMVDVDGAGAGAAQTVLVLENTAVAAMKIGTNVVGVSVLPPTPVPPVASPTAGSAGNDTLTGTAASETIDGRAGIDTLDLSKNTAGFKLDLAANKVDFGGGHLDTLVSIENVTGGSGKDNILANEVANLLRGGAGDDYISARGGNDTIFGGDGRDDILGGDGNDHLFGGNGIDILTGGKGNDVFYKLVRGETTDYLTDFNAKEDKLDLVELNKVVKAAFGHELTSEYLSFVQVGKAAEVRMDVDGSGPIGSETLFSLDNMQASLLKIDGNVMIHDHADHSVA